MSDGVRTALRGLGQTLMTLGVVVLLFCVYELWVTGLVTAREQDRLRDDLAQTWAEPGARPGAEGQPGEPVPVSLDLGEGFAVLHVPSLEDYAPWVVVEGTSTADLKNGPGHIAGTALPGELGNVVISGHRTTYGAPFQRFGDLADGHTVVLETREGWFTYTVRQTSIVLPSAVEVTFPVPGEPDAEPTERLLTLTTCHPQYSARERLIVQAELTAATARADGPPPALTGSG
jgi:sortase A